MTAPTQPDTAQIARVVKLAWLCLFVAVVVLVIDNQIKRHIVDEASKALVMLATAQRLLKEASGGREPAGEASAGPGDSVDVDHGVDDASGASAEPDADEGGGLGPQASRVARPFGGPGGDG
jgi:hypothetical protein